jgi:hypothetical protein
MDRPRSLRAVIVPLALLLLAVACERGETDPSPSPTAADPTETSTIEAPPGSYRYEGLGVAAVLAFDGPAGTLEVRNDTEVELGEPHLYVFTADEGAKIDLTTRDPGPVPPGADLTFGVTYDTGSPIGMVFLMFGDDDFGAFVPVRKAGA